MGITAMEARALADFIRQSENAPGAPSKGAQNKIVAAKVKLACYALKAQGMKPTLDNLASVLGPDFKDALSQLREIREEMGQDGPILKG